MFRTTSEAEGEVGRLINRFKPPVIFYITDRSKAVLCSLCLLVSVSVSVLFSPALCLDDI